VLIEQPFGAGTSFDDMSKVSMKPFVPLNSYALGPSLYASNSLGVIAGRKIGVEENLPHENDRRSPARGVSIGRNLLRSSTERFPDRCRYDTGRTSGVGGGRQRSDAVVPRKSLQVTNVN